jgi:ribosomal protein S18 acetylase RimI-like enzyme
MKLSFDLLCKEQAMDAASIIVKAYQQPPWNEVWKIEQALKSVYASLESPHDRCFAAYDAQKVVGVLLGRIQSYMRDGFYVLQLSVLPDYQYMGIGKQLLNFCEDKIKAEGINHFELITAPHDVAFYKKCGYSISDAVHFEKDT